MSAHVREVLSSVSHCAIALIFCGAIVIAPIAAQAQLLEEVVVTAQKREQSIQDVGISITAFTGDQIDQLGFENSVDIAALTAGVFTTGNLGGQTTLFTIRGVVQNDFLDVTESPVAVYIDEGYIPMIQGQMFASFDVDRVEVLKGPQGTLFGRNATGGLVHFVTRKPTRETEGFADVSYGSYNHVRAEAALGGPLTDTISARISGLYNSHDGIFDNKFPDQAPGASIYPFGVTGPGNTDQGDVWNDDSWAVRGQLLFEPNDKVEVLLSGFGAGTDTGAGGTQSFASIPVIDSAGRFVNSVESGPNNVCEAISLETSACVPIEGLDGELLQPGNPFGLPPSFDVGGVVFGLPFAAPEDGLRPRPGGDLFGYIDPDGDDLDVGHDISRDDADSFESYGFTGKLTVDFDNDITLTSVSNYMHFDKLVFVDTDGAPVPQGIFASEAEEDTFSQELRFSGEFERARWVAGFYYLYIDNTNTSGLALPINSPLLGLGNLANGEVIPGVFTPFLGTEANNEVSLETNSYSIFGQLDIDLTNKLTFVAGLRTIIEDQEYSRTITAYANTDDYVVETASPVIGAGFAGDGVLRPAFTDDRSSTLWAGKLQFEYRPNDDWLIYAGINRGVKAGSYNAKVADGTPFLPDSSIPYDEEVLTSYEIGFKSTLFNGTTRLNGSYYFYDYKDYQAFVFVRSSGFIVNNDAEMQGIELDLQSNPYPGLDIMLSGALIDAEVANLEVAPSVFRDVSPAFTPSVQLAGVVRYEFPQRLFNGALAVQLDGNYNSNFYHNIRNFAAQKIPSYVIGNAKVSWTSTDDKWTGTVFVNNLADARNRLIGFDVSNLCGCVTYSYGKPRWVGFNLRYNYGN